LASSTLSRQLNSLALFLLSLLKLFNPARVMGIPMRANMRFSDTKLWIHRSNRNAAVVPASPAADNTILTIVGARLTVNPTKETTRLRVIPTIYLHRAKHPAPRNKALPFNRVIEISKNYLSNTADRSDLYLLHRGIPRFTINPVAIKNYNNCKKLDLI